MPLLKKQNEPLLGIWKVEESIESLLSLLDNSADYITALETMRTESRKKEWLATRVLLKELLGKEYPIAYHSNGAPYLPDTNLSISISHTKDYVAVLLSENAYAGVDIEYKAERVKNIRSRFMTSDDEANLDPNNELNHLLLYWCAKETLFKLIGQQDVDFRQHLHVAPFQYANEGELWVNEAKTSEKRVFLLKFLVAPDYVITYSV